MNQLEIRPVIVGSVGACLIALRWFRLRNSVPRWTLLPAILCISYVFFRAWLFDHTYSSSWYTLDTYPYYADQSFGFNPSVVSNHLIERLHLFPVISIVYESLMLAVACTYAYSLGRPNQPLRILVLMVLAGLLGAQAYRLLPACGAVYLLGSPCYLGQEPSSCTMVAAADLHPIGMNPIFPRNAIPSMHVTWALLIYWVWRTSRWHWVALGYTVLTVLATLGGGEHYLVDIVAAFPFALVIWTMCGAGWGFDRSLTLVSAILGFLTWVFVIRFNPQVLHQSVLIPWVFSALLIGGTVVAVRRISPDSTKNVSMLSEPLTSR